MDIRGELFKIGADMAMCKGLIDVTEVMAQLPKNTSGKTKALIFNAMMKNERVFKDMATRIGLVVEKIDSKTRPSRRRKASSE